jgi:hypothetical protein
MVFIKGYYETPTTAITLPSDVALVGVDGAILQWPSNRSTVTDMFTISAGTQNVVIQGLQFEAGVTVPVGGLTDGSGGGTFIGIGAAGSANKVQQVTIQNNRFGVMRYGRNQQEGTYGTDINIRSSVDGLTIRENFMDAAPTNVIYMRGHASVAPVYRRFVFQDNIVSHSQGEHSFGSALQPLLLTYATYGHFEDFVIEGNTFHDVNSTINVDMGGYGLNISNNTVKSDNLDGIISAVPPGVPPDDEEIIGFIVSSNACYGDDEPSHQDKVPETSCQLNVGGRNGVVIGNSLRSISQVGNLNVKYSDNVLVASNTVEMADNEGNCYSLVNSSHVRYVNNICIDGSMAFVVVEAFGYDNDHLEFVGNVLRTSSTASAPTYFLNFSSGAGDVVVRGNEVRGNFHQRRSLQYESSRQHPCDWGVRIQDRGRGDIVGIVAEPLEGRQTVGLERRR